MVVSYSNESIGSEQFLTFREKRVKQIVDFKVPSILFSSAPFTGKTSLCALLYQHLKDLGKNVKFVDFLSYTPWKDSIEIFWHRKTGFNFEETKQLANNGKEEIFFLLDEFQRTYFSLTKSQLYIWMPILKY